MEENALLQFQTRSSNRPFGAFLPTIALIVIGGVPVGAQTSPEPPKPWQYSATVDMAYSDNLDHPTDGTNLLRNFDQNANAFNFPGVSLDLQYTAQHYGFHIDTGYGDMYKTIGAADPWRGPNQYVTQAFVSYKPINGSALQIDFGKFFTSAGAEVPDILSNSNYSRSLLFVLGAPYYHFGVRATIPVTKEFTTSVQVVNGWNDVKDNNTGKTLALNSTLTKTKWNWSQTYIVGPEKVGTNRGFRNLYDTVLNITPCPWFQGYVEALAGFENSVPSVGLDTERVFWGGYGTSVKFTPAKKFAFSPRWESYHDPNGFTSGLSQKLTEWTATAEYRPLSFMTWRLEFRADHSNRRFFDTGLRQNQRTVLLALILNKKGEW